MGFFSSRVSITSGMVIHTVALKRTQLRSQFYFTWEIRFPYNQQPVKRSRHLCKACDYTPFDWWDIAANVCKLVYWFQRLAISDIDHKPFFKIYIHLQVDASCCLLWVIQQGFGFGWCIFKKFKIICEVCVRHCFSRLSSAFWISLSVKPFYLNSFIDVRSILSKQIILYISTEYISLQDHNDKKLVSPSDEPNIAFAFL